VLRAVPEYARVDVVGFEVLVDVWDVEDDGFEDLVELVAVAGCEAAGGEVAGFEGGGGGGGEGASEVGGGGGVGERLKRSSRIMLRLAKR
jgi:hypothetical protein